VPNLTVDSLVSRHARAVADAGDAEWLPDGVRFREWSVRCAKGRAVVAERKKAKEEKKKKANASAAGGARRTNAVFISLEDDGGWLVRDDEGEDDSEYEEVDGGGEDVRGLVVHNVRRARAPRRSGGEQ
jgi:hypothetical protein